MSFECSNVGEFPLTASEDVTVLLADQPSMRTFSLLLATGRTRILVALATRTLLMGLGHAISPFRALMP